MFSIENSTIQRNGGKWTIHDSAGKLHTFKDGKELLEMIKRRVAILDSITVKVVMSELNDKAVVIKPYKVKEKL